MHHYLQSEERLAALRREEILDTAAEESFDRLTRLAGKLLNTPLALLSLVDDERQFFKSFVGLSGAVAEKRETALSHSICKHVVESRSPLIIPETRAHPLVYDNPVIQELEVESYLGFPISSSDGHVLGSFCVIDRVRRDWTAEEIELVGELSLQVEQALSLRYQLKARNRAERKLRDLLEHAPIGIFSVDREWNLLALNRKVEELLGSESPSEVVADWFEISSLFTGFLSRVERDETDGFEIARLKSGREVQIYANRGESDSAELTQIFLIDVTEERVAKWQAQEVEALVRERERIESLGLLAGGIAHDFNNLLTTISANLELLETGMLPNPQERLESHRDMREAVTQAGDIVDKMLTYTGRAIKKESAVDLNEVVQTTLAALGKKLAGNTEVELDLQEIQYVWGNSSELAEVLMNLVINAREAIDTGGRIEVRTRMQVTSDSCQQIVLEVTDDGEGIPEGHLTRIFDPFFTTRFTGRGLGLATVHGIVKAHSGEISADSSPGVGTTIRVLFPSAGSGVTGGPEDRYSQAGSEKSRVLVVDDETAVRVSVVRLLERSGFEVESASGGVEAIQILSASDVGFDLVLMDITMPDLNGVDATLKIFEKNSSQSVVLMSGYHDHQLPEGHSGFLSKPFTRAELVSCVESALARRAKS